MFGNKMLVLLKLCAPALVLVMVARAQVDICDNVPVLAATSTPQILTSVSIETGVFNLVYCTVQITVPAGSSLKIEFTSIVDPGFDPAFVFPQEPFSGEAYLVGVSYNEVTGYGPPIYVFPQSVYITIEYDVTPSSTFVMTYQTVPFEEDICNMMPQVYAINTTQEVVSPNFGNGPYFDNQACVVEIIASTDVRIVVRFFDMVCPNDDVFICDDNQCTSLCNTNQRIFRDDVLFVVFITNTVLGTNGMRAEYTEVNIPDFTEWTPWMSTYCSSDCTTSMLNDTRTRTCNFDICEGETNQERIRVCESYCSKCVLP